MASRRSDRIAETKRLLEQHGIDCWGTVTLQIGERNLAAKDKTQRAKSIAYVKSVVQMAADLSGKIVTIVPATVGKIVPDGTPEQEWRWVVDALKEVYELSERLNIRLALEPLNRFETYFLNRADQALALASEVGPNCGVCLDAFHLNIEEADMFAAIRSAKGRLADFHVADNNRLAAGMGALDWPRIVRALTEIGYDGALTNEFVAPVDRTPVSPFPEQIEQNPVDISPEQLKFIEDHGSSLLSDKFYTALVEKTAQTIRPLIGA